ncbi:MAG: IS91 family transposase [Parcubacteria group bacterium]
MSTHSLELADIFRVHGPAYKKQHRLPRNQLRVLNAIERCRTASLGGHVDRCNDCGHERISYNSCRNRHCPKCGSLAKEKWLQARQRELLPVPYFHIVFTLPDELNTITLYNKRQMYTMLFHAAAETLICLSRDPKHLGGEIGLIGVLHTWGQNLMNHPHLHCIVPGGALSFDGQRWIGSRKNFFIPVHVLSQVFRGKFLASLKSAYRKKELQLEGALESLRSRTVFQGIINTLYAKGWVVYAKQPFGGPEQVLGYLGRYTHRVALTNNRLVSMSDGKVSFRWRDYRDGKKEKLMTIDASEFIRRFLLHVLPEGLCKIRYYGFLSNRHRLDQLLKCQEMLGVQPTNEKADAKSWQDVLLEVTGVDIRICPHCHKGRMQRCRILEPAQNAPP